MDRVDTDPVQPSKPSDTGREPLPLVRSVVGGILMGLANLVPGVSGGTMILVMGLYDEFITALADVTRFQFTRRNVVFLAIVGGAAAVAIAALAGTLSRAVTYHRSAMFSLFIGLTLGGAPLLARIIKRPSASAVTGLLIGLAIMATIAATKDEPKHAEALTETVAAGGVVIEPRYGRDVAAGALGMSAMVLPGISGAYMLLIVGRYETILASIDLAKDYALSLGREGDALVFLRVVIPTGLGAIASLVLLSNFLKWMLRRHQKLMLGLLLGILLGSVVGIWPFDAASQAGDYLLGAALGGAGFVSTLWLSKIKA